MVLSFRRCFSVYNLMFGIVGSVSQQTVSKSPANTSSSNDIRFKPYDLNSSLSTNKSRSSNVKSAAATSQRNSPNNGSAENGTVTVGKSFRCYVCERLFPVSHMQWFVHSISFINMIDV